MIDVLKSALSRTPCDRDVIAALISYEVEEGNFASAVSRAELLAELKPDDRETRRLLETVRSLAR